VNYLKLNDIYNKERETKMTLKEYGDLTMKEIKKVLSQQQLNNIYLASTIKAIRDTKEDDNEETITKLQYMRDIQKVMEKKEEYEICHRLQIMIKILEGRIEEKRKNKRANNK